MHYRIKIQEMNIDAPAGANLLEVLRDAGVMPEAPCGGNGKCGKCSVLLDGREVLACQTAVDRDMTVLLPRKDAVQVLTRGIPAALDARREAPVLAFDIGTTTVAGFLLKSGRVLVTGSAPNPQASFGADVVSRIQHAAKGKRDALTACIRSCVAKLTRELYRNACIDPDEIATVSLVGNPAMQQLYLGMDVSNLVKIPFHPVLTKAEALDAAAFLPECKNAKLLTVPDISAYVGADTVACILAADMDRKQDISLLVDIGTNGEMALGNRDRMAVCSAAAGPALEGAGISCGIVAAQGAIDHVEPLGNAFRCSVIGGGEATGICGSGIVDAVAAALDMGLLNSRGRILNPQRVLSLTETLTLTQEDIRQVQLAKGAIAAGIECMISRLGIRLEDIQNVYLAGAFGSFLTPEAACRIGLLPKKLERRITAIGNAAGTGAMMLACSDSALRRAERIAETTAVLELGSEPGFQRCFAAHMRF